MAWSYAFKKLHPALPVQISEVLSLAGARNMNKNDVNLFFEMFEKIMSENDMFGEPVMIHSADEFRLQLNNLPQNIVTMKGKKL
jgi:hypothetical protein